jgi:hypothetical protein
MHQPAIAHGRKQKWKTKIEAQNPGAQIALRNRDGMPRPERDIVEYPAILPQRNLALGSAIQIVEY